MTETSSISKFASPLRDLKDRPFLILLTLGLFVRLALMFLYYPAVMLSFDSPRYARVGPQEFFGDFWMPTGYPLLLHVLHSVTRELWFTIVIQHLLGLATGVILYLAMSRLGLRRWIACLPAAVVFLSGDQLYLEHQLIADSFFIFLAIAGLGAAVAWMSGEKPGWLAVASVLLAMAALTRSVGVVCLPILLLVATATVKGSLRHRGMTLAVALLPGVAVFVFYFAAFKLAHGEYAGLTDMSGWNLYSRVAPFADCREFTPPQGTATLCEASPSSQRPGPYGYVWDANSIARRHFALRPNDKLKAFSWQVVLHQPGDYLEAVGIDLLRYIEPSIVAPRGYSGQPPEILSFTWRDLSVERLVVKSLAKKYRGTTVHLHGGRILGAYQNLFRVGGLALAALIAFTLVGMIWSRGQIRFALILFGLNGLCLYIIPVLTISYDFRYGIPAQILVVVSGLLGIISFWPIPAFRLTNK
jgi:hypothetical protein